MLCKACSRLESSTEGFVPFEAVKALVNDQAAAPSLSFLVVERPTEEELLALCETPGDPSNGGGRFDVRDDGTCKAIRWTPSLDQTPLMNGVGRASGIGSPIIGPGSGWGR